MVLHYCDRCGQRIPEAEQQAGRAQINAEGIATCAKCLAAAAPQPPTAASGTSRRTRGTGVVPRPLADARGSDAGARGTERGGRQTVRRAGGSPPARIVLIGLGVLVAIAVVITLVIASPSRDSTSTTQAAGTRHERDVRGTTGVPRVAAGQPAGTAAPPVPAKDLAAYPLPQGGKTDSQQAATSAPPASPAAGLRVPPTGGPDTPVGPAKQEDTYDPRGEVAASLLAQALAFNKANPDDLWTYRDKLDDLKSRYGSTQGGKEAARLLSEIKMPEVDPATNPAPPPETAWATATQVLPLVDPTRNRQNGNWNMAGGVLRSDKSMWARLALPYLVPEEYDLRVTFSRVDNMDCLLVVLGRKGRPFIFSIGSGNNRCSFETVKESRRDSLPTKTLKPNLYPNNQRCQVTIQVRSKCLRAYLNGKPIVGCQVEDDGLSLAPELQAPQPNQLGLATWNSVYEFHALEVLPVTGEGQILK